MTGVLLTGFEPFGGDLVNPAAEVVTALNGQRVGGHDVTGVVLPCVFGASLESLRAQLRLRDWSVVLCLGLAASRPVFSVERIAINVDDAHIPDNAGQQPVDSPVVPGGPAGLFSTLPIKRMVSELQAAGLGAEVSQTAGTYVCNHVFYGLMHWASTQARPPRCGFVHVPALSHTPLTTQVDAVRLALRAALAAGDDIRTTGGAIE